MKIYNTLSRKKEEFAPLRKGHVGMYVCGPTVYDEPHIGHARSAYVFDVIKRYLEYKGYKVKFVRNVTDVDDKIINKARQEFKGKNLNSAVQKISEKYLRVYHEDMAKLGISKPSAEPKATKYIKNMIKFIKTLIDRGAGYESGGDVYFDIKKAKDYGKLSNQSLEMMESGARISPGDNKKDPLDFALWKKAKENEPSWPSPWGKGRPGWHIECSAMSSDILGDEFDIHAGGIDLIFPHHENEIAQSEGAGKKFANVWVHNGLLTINGEKMAKSLGNFITIRDFQAKYKDMDLLKLLFLLSHYRHPVDYTEEKIKQMKKVKERIQIFLKRANELLKKYNKHRGPIYLDYISPFTAAMNDDFNTPVALSVIFKCVEDGNKRLDKRIKKEEEYNDLFVCRDFIRDTSKKIFGLNLECEKINDSSILAKINEREKMRKNKDFKKADKIRKELLEKNIIVEDTKEGTKWRRKL